MGVNPKRLQMVGGVVSYSAQQELTDEQKAQARDNIGANTVRPFPIYDIMEYPAMITYVVDLLSLENNVFYSLSENLVTPQKQIWVRFVVVCQDGTVKQIINYSYLDQIAYTRVQYVDNGTGLVLYPNSIVNNYCIINISDTSTSTAIPTPTTKGLRYFLGVNNTDEYTPTGDYHPATKKYVDDSGATKITAPETATVGQQLLVESVDENGMPTSWKTEDRTHYEGPGEIALFENEPWVGCASDPGINYYDFGAPFKFNTEHEYRVIIDGWETVIQPTAAMYCAFTVNGMNCELYPISNSNPSYAMLTCSASISTISIYEKGIVIHPIDEKYIPDTIARVEDIPDAIPAPSTAEVGQTIVVKAVDGNGKPTEWEVGKPSYLPSELDVAFSISPTLRKIADVTVTADENGEYPSNITVTEDMEGNPLNCKKVIVETNIKSTVSYGSVRVSSKGGTPMSIQYNNGSFFGGIICASKTLSRLVLGNTREIAGNGSPFQVVGINYNGVTTQAIDSIDIVVVPQVGAIAADGFLRVWEVID